MMMMMMMSGVDLLKRNEEGLAINTTKRIDAETGHESMNEKIKRESNKDEERERSRNTGVGGDKEGYTRRRKNQYCRFYENRNTKRCSY